MNIQPGDKIMVKIGDREIETTIDENGTQRLPKNQLYTALLDTGSIDLNKLAVAYKSGTIPFNWYLDFYLNIGYSMCGFAEISCFQHLEIHNPLWAPKRDVTVERMKEMRGNTEFWEKLWPRLNTEAFVKQAKHYLDNCRFCKTEQSYDASIINIVTPEALTRIEELDANNTKLVNLVNEIYTVFSSSQASGEWIKGHLNWIKIDLAKITGQK